MCCQTFCGKYYRNSNNGVKKNEYAFSFEHILHCDSEKEITYQIQTCKVARLVKFGDNSTVLAIPQELDRKDASEYANYLRINKKLLICS